MMGILLTFACLWFQLILSRLISDDGEIPFHRHSGFLQISQLDDNFGAVAVKGKTIFRVEAKRGRSWKA